MRERQEEQALLDILERRGRFLRFPTEIERAFQQDYAARFHRHMFVATLLIVSIFFLTSIFDLAYAEAWRIPTSIRFAIIGPILMLLLVMTWVPAFKSVGQFILLTVAILIGTAWLSIAYVLPEPMKEMYYQLIFLVQIYAFTLSRLQFRPALLVAIVLWVFLTLTLFFDPTLGSYSRTSHHFLFICASILTLLANYHIENFSRRDYLQRRLLALEKQNLEEVNLHLHHLAHQDVVSGISNRRGFNVLIDREWRRAQRFNYPIAMIIADIDYFKEFNDSYGHQKGDECLRSVGKILAAQTKRPGDLAARYGGDEFILVLMGTNLEEVHVIAETIEKEIKKLAIPHEASTAADIVTLTMGVASLVPARDDAPIHLINQADKALYQGKIKGRACVVSYQNTTQ